MASDSPIVREVTRVGAGRSVEDLPAPMFAEIAFAGRSNVGKSSLINALLGRKNLVHTSGTPGATRKLQIFRVEIRDGPCIDFVDLPGYGYARRSKAERRSWGPMVEGFLRTRAGLRAIVVIIDARRGLQEDDLQLIEFADHLELHTIVVTTKLDKLQRSKRKPRVAELQQEAGRPVLGVSATESLGRHKLWRVLLKAV